MEAQQASTLAKNILEVLDKHYPNYKGFWNIVIRTDPTGGVVQVRNLLITGKYGFQIPITWLSNHDDLVKIIKDNGGQLLERYGLSRDWRADSETEVSNMKRDYKGEAVGDVSK